MRVSYNIPTNAKENVSTAIWGAFDLSEGKLKEDKAKKILEDLRKS